MTRPEAERREQIARALLIADDGGNADFILAATEHAGDCPFVAAPAAYTCSRCQADHYRMLADAVLALPAEDARRVTVDAEFVEAVRRHIASFEPGTLCGSELNVAHHLAEMDGDKWAPWLVPGEPEIDTRPSVEADHPAIVERIGWDETGRFTATLVYNDGPPALPFDVVWKSIPVWLSLSPQILGTPCGAQSADSHPKTTTADVGGRG